LGCFSLKPSKIAWLIVYIVAILVVVFNNIVGLITAFKVQGLNIDLLLALVMTFSGVGIYVFINVLNGQKVGW
jgi:hypothetical protein